MHPVIIVEMAKEGVKVRIWVKIGITQEVTDRRYTCNFANYCMLAGLLLTLSLADEHHLIRLKPFNFALIV